MPTTFPNGVTAPDPGDRIGADGVQGMRAVAATADAAIGARVKLGDARLNDARHPLPHRHDIADVDGIEDRFDDIESAYDVAVADGFTGTRSEWLDSLTGPRGPEGPAGGTAVTDPQVRDMLADAETDTGAWVDAALRRGVSVREYGALGDGVADDSAPMQAALDRSGSVHVPAGVYLISEPLQVRSGTVVDMAPDAVIRVGDGVASAFTISGDRPEAAINLAAEPTMDERGVPVFETVAPHGLSVGDMVRVRSQRDALHSDAGDDWRLGYGTDSVQGSRFAEFTQVSDVISPTEFAGSQPLTFPSYRPDDAEETSEYAGAASTVRRYVPVENVTIRGGVIEGAPATAIAVTYSRAVRVEGVRYIAGGEGTFVSFALSWACEAFGCHVTYPPDEASNIYRRNAYKATSAQDCGYRGCSADNASQSFDISYSATGGPSLFCYVEECSTRGAQNNGATSHGGTYANRFMNNRFLGNRRSGLANRGRSSLIIGNHVEGHVGETNYGIALTEGWARDCVVSGNVVTGFRYGFRFGDSTDVNRRFEWVGLTLSGNTFTGCKTAVELHRWISAGTNTECGVSVLDNTINMRDPGDDSYGVRVANWLNGVAIRGNRFTGGGVAKTAIRVEADATGTFIEQNTFASFTERGVDALPPENMTSTKYVVVQGNRFSFIPSAGRFEVRDGVQARGWAFFEGDVPIVKMNLSTSATNAQIVNALRYYGLVGIP